MTCRVRFNSLDGSLLKVTGELDRFERTIFIGCAACEDRNVSAISSRKSYACVNAGAVQEIMLTRGNYQS